MDAITLDAVALRVDRARFAEAMQLTQDGPFWPDAAALIEGAERVARPKGVYRLAAAEADGDGAVRLGGVRFVSRVLRVNLDGLSRVFPYVATCGAEIAQWAEALDADPVRRFWGDALKQMALEAAVCALSEHAAASYGLGVHAAMNPGSLEDWPLAQQAPLFSLFEGAPAGIGVTLTESFLMRPLKSVSGVWFETDKDYVNCRLCPREACPNRRAPYDAHLYARDYEPGGGNRK